MHKKLVTLAVLLVMIRMPAFAGDVTVSVGGDNSFNNNSGSITVNQKNTISNRDVGVEERLDTMLSKAATALSSSRSTPDQKKEASQTAHFGAMAKDINSMQASMQQKNRLCHSKAKGMAEILGYNVGFYFAKCDEVFN